ncbi:uncharacterized protein LOC110897271 isoform X2 [Helianthus annuus]|uniref:uncharacterized protein LOC110897271 isoform X2 n=1 Tax=Helianthus annuus TaxID=4232 RepID=UPI000B8F9075|nr:uncharacterized protein LOC110897271 isoform X2 [Helianthus annuus]
MSGPFVKKKLILRFEGRRSWALSFEKFSPSEIIRDHLGLSCCNVDCKFLVDEEYAQNIKIERSGNKFFFSRDWVKVVQQIKMKFATFVLFQYMGQRKYKLIVFMNDSTQLIVSHPQANPKAAHDMVYHQLIPQNHQVISTFTVIARNRFRFTNQNGKSCKSNSLTKD